MRVRKSIKVRIWSLVLACFVVCQDMELIALAAEADAGIRSVWTEDDAEPAKEKEESDRSDVKNDTDGSGESGAESDADDSVESDVEGDTEDSEEAGEESNADDSGESDVESDADKPEEFTGEPEEDSEDYPGEEKEHQVPETISENAIAAVMEEPVSEPGGLRVAYHTKEEVREYLLQSSARLKNTVTYEEMPEDIPPYVPGVLSERTRQSALAMLNQVRYIAGLSCDVKLDEGYDAECQAACLVSYLNGVMSHEPEKPADMEEELYQLAANGAGRSNLGIGHDNINDAIIHGWMYDGNEANISEVGHRRWLLNPVMDKTGFGFVGRHSAVYAFDQSGDGQGVYDAAWPAQNMPLEYFSDYHPWSVSLGGVDVSEMWVKLTQKGTGQVWNLSKASRDGEFYIAAKSYGISNCIIFRPSGVHYKDGDVFEVEIKKDGETYLSYTVQFFSMPELLETEPAEPEPSSKVTISDKTYDGKAITYTGRPVVTDLAGNEVTGVALTAYYSGTLYDGSVYEKSTEAPVQAGKYRLLFELSEDDAKQYKLSRQSYVFRIEQKEVRITAKRVEVEVGDPLPVLEENGYTVEGLLSGDELIKAPSLRFGTENITTETAAVYDIIPYDADAGNNYVIRYINGSLVVGEKIIESGQINDLFWKIDSTMKLTITGSGDYKSTGRPPWADKPKVLSAVVEVTDITSMHDMFAWCMSLESVDFSKTDTSKVTDMSNMFYACEALKEIDLGNLDTGMVENMSGMFSRCFGLERVSLKINTANVKKMSNMFDTCRRLMEADLSSLDVRNVSDMKDIFSDCSGLTHIITPRNCSCEVTLPTGGTWYQDVDVVCETLPRNLPYSIDLYRDQFPADGKRPVYIAGVNAEDRIYDGTAVPYADHAVLVSSAGETVSGVELTAAYAGTLADGSVYEESSQPPSQAGTYTLLFGMTGADADGYALRNPEYKFRIRQRKVTITAPDRVIRTGSPLPDLSAIKDYKVSGLLEGEQLTIPPSFRYGTEEVSADRPGSYEIIPYGAEVGCNYEIVYVNSTLRIEEAGGGEEPDPEFGDIYPEDIPEDGIIPEGLWIAGLAQEGYAYTGKALKPTVRVYDHTTLLQEKRDYTVAWTRNVKVYDYGMSDGEFEEGKAPIVTVKGRGNYSGKETQVFRIRPLDIGKRENPDGSENDEILAVESMTIVCNGKAQRPVPELLWHDRKLKKGKDYTIAYYENESGRKIGSIKEAGYYRIMLTGTGNYTGTREIHLRVINLDVEDLKPVSKLSVAKIPNQSYADGKPDQTGTGAAVMPILTVKDGRTVLKKGIHYEVSYHRNTAAGTAYAVVTGIEEGGYSGTKRVAFRITGTPINKAIVMGLPVSIPYEGMSIEPELQLTVKRRTNGSETVDYLTEGRDYTIAWQKNENAGTAAVLITGIGGYTGTIKKSFKIKGFDIAGNEDGRFSAVLENRIVRYAKGGARPKPTVTFLNGEGKVETLTEGKDYTLSYMHPDKVTGEDGPQSLVIIKGRGNFSGTYSERITYEIIPQDLSSLTLTAQDKIYKNKRNIFATKITVTDMNGNLLKAGIDYDKNPVYTYQDETGVHNEDEGGDEVVVRSAGERVNQNDIIPAGTVLNVKVMAKEGGSYTGELEGRYRITRNNITSASVSVRKQTYTGREIVLDKSQITVKIKGRPIDADQWEIVEGSYKNNVRKGSASVTIRGLDNYGGTKNVKFTIGAKGFLWWWRK